MSIMMGGFRAALVDAGAGEEKAGKATEVATHQGRLAAIEARFTLLTGMVSVVIAMVGSLVPHAYR